MLVSQRIKFDSLKIYYQNIRGLRTKTQELFGNVICNDYDVIVLTETWLNGSIHDAEVFDIRYTVHRRDRETSGFSRNKDGGGVLIAVANHLNSQRLTEFESNCENLWVSIQPLKNSPKNTKFYICATYIPPPVQSHILKDFLDSASKAMDIFKDINVLFMGDFNLGNLKWHNNPDTNALQANCDNSAFGNMLIDFMSFYSLKQYNNVVNINGRVLDLVFGNVSISDLIANADPLSKVDNHHPPLEFSINYRSIDKGLSICNQARYRFYKADYSKIIERLGSIDWAVKLSNHLSIDEMVAVFYSELHIIINELVPKSKPINNNYPVWFNPVLIGLLREKSKYRYKIKKFNNPRDALSFDLLRKRCQALQRKCYSRYVHYIESSLKSNPRLFWSFIKNKRAKSSSYPSVLSCGNASASRGPEVCNLFANHFSSTYNRNNTPSADQIPSIAYTSNFLSTLSFSSAEVYKVIKRLDSTKGSGADGIPSLFVVRCAESIAYPLSIIFNKSLSSGQFPKFWKKSLVIPLYKNGDPGQVDNYRPISILCVFAKIFEKLIHPVLEWHLKQLLTQHQHAFVKSRSTSTNLVTFVEYLSKEIDSRCSVDTIYTDFSKAFDRVPHELLLTKLGRFGIAGSLLNWFKTYLYDRESVVVVNGYMSDNFKAHSGVPQGSHLGPILFNIFINDLPLVIHNSNCLLFADDLKIYRRVDNTTDVRLLQDDIDRLSRWCDCNGMSLNVKKCFILRFTKKKKPLTRTYNINGHKLQDATVSRDLGIIMDSKLRFDVHIDAVCQKSLQMLGFITRSCKAFKYAQSKIIIYNALVKSKLEYCSPAWNPYYKTHVERIEKVQKKFLYHLSYSDFHAKKLPSYSDRLLHYKMSSLERRRKFQDCFFFYKLLNGQLDAPGLLANINLRVPSRIPRSGKFHLFHLNLFKSNLGQHSPLNRISATLNEILANHNIDVFNTSLNAFKRLVISVASGIKKTF